MAEVSTSSSVAASARAASAPHSSGNSAWLGVLMPSMADVVFVALLGTLVFTPFSVRLLNDAGIGWHIRTGQEILATHSVPRAWLAWEWMYDVVVGELESVAGLNGVVWFTAVVIAAVFAWTFRLLLRSGTNVLVALVLVLLAVSAAMIHFLGRPHVVSWLFTLAWFAVLDSSEKESARNKSYQAYPSSRLLWILPLLMILWVNVHGGFLFGFALLGVFWLGAVWEWFRARSDRIEESLAKIAAAKRARDLFVVGAVSALATLVNPYGWKLHAHIYSYLTNRFLMDHIEEFQSPNFHGMAQRCFLVLLLIAFAAVAVRGRALRMSQMLTLLLAVYSGLYATRNIPVSAILLVLMVGPLMVLGNLLGNQRRSIMPSESDGFLRRMAGLELELRGHLWPIVMVAATFAIAVNGGRLGSSRLMDAHFDRQRMPVAAVDFLDARHVNGRILSVDSWGGYLIYRHIPVVLDDRHDMYGDEFFKSYLKMIHVENGWREFLVAHPASCVLLPRNTALANVLVETPGWKAVYSDAVAVVFVPDGFSPEAAARPAY